MQATTGLMSSRFIWLGLAAYIKELFRKYTVCQQAKVTGHSGQPLTLVEKNDIPQQCFCHMPVDLVVPMPTSCTGDWYFLTVLDPSTRWFDYISLLDITEEPVLEAFILGWVIHFSMPRRAPLTGEHCSLLACGLPGVKTCRWSTLPLQLFHPQANKWWKCCVTNPRKRYMQGESSTQGSALCQGSGCRVGRQSSLGPS